MDIFREMAFRNGFFDFLKEKRGFHFFHIAESRQLLLQDFCFGKAHDIAQLVDFFANAEGKGFARLARAARPSYAVDIIFLVLRDIVINDDVNIVYVNTACRNVCCDKDLNRAVAKFLHDLVTLCLLQIPMQALREIATPLQKLCQVVHALFRVAEYHCQIWVIHVNQTRQRVKLALFFYVKVILFNVGDSQFLADDFNEHRVLLETFCDIQYFRGKRSGKEQCLVFSGDFYQNSFNILTETHIKHFIGFIQNHHLYAVCFERAAAHMVHDAPGCADDNLRAFFQGKYLPVNGLTAVNGQYADIIPVFQQLAEFFADLYCQFAGGAED